jgi:hypothetical protein
MRERRAGGGSFGKKSDGQIGRGFAGTRRIGRFALSQEENQDWISHAAESFTS